VLGFFVGLGRVSKNWLLVKLAEGYVELLRNVPVILQVIFWSVIIRNLPSPRDAIQLADFGFLTNRDLTFAILQSHPGWRMHYLDKVHIADQAHKFPLQLSGGQQQRVAIARALCMEPEILLFDEPTSALDPEMIKEVLDVMLDLADGGMTMIVVTHEMGFVRTVADKVILMADGRIVESAPPERFFSQPEHPRTQQFLEQILSH